MEMKPLKQWITSIHLIFWDRRITVIFTTPSHSCLPLRGFKWIPLCRHPVHGHLRRLHFSGHEECKRDLGDLYTEKANFTGLALGWTEFSLSAAAARQVKARRGKAVLYPDQKTDAIVKLRRQGKAIPYQHKKTDSKGKLQVTTEETRSVASGENFGVLEVIAGKTQNWSGQWPAGRCVGKMKA